MSLDLTAEKSLILYEKTIETKGYSVKLASTYEKVCVKCDDCGKEYDKIRRDLLAWEGKCASCVGKIRGKMMGDKFGKSQVLKGKCINCGEAVRSTVKYCSSTVCQAELKKSKSIRFSGAKNPAWTGKHVCGCGSKKSFGALQCRPCSFKGDKRSGKNNGRFVSKNREKYLECTKTRRILSNLMSNVCKSGGITKNYKKTADILGYSWKEFKEHIESKFEDGDSWNNYGKDGWSVDHILPVDWFIKNQVFDIKIVNCLNNLKPMNTKDNIKKSKSLTMDDPWSFYEHLKSSV